MPGGPWTRPVPESSRPLPDLLSPAVLCFLLVAAACFARSDLRLPDAIFNVVSVYLVLSIGLKGGTSLSATTFSAFAFPALGALVLGCAISPWSYAFLRWMGGGVQHGRRGGGGAIVLGTLAASASYIAAPVALRLALPEADPGLYLTASLAITFPFNITRGMGIHAAMARSLCGT